MGLRAKKFTPEVLLSAPRRSEGIPNSDASKVLYSVSTYSFDDHAKASEIRLLDSKSQESSLVTDKNGSSEPQWLDDDTVLLLHGDEGGVTHIKVGPVQHFGDGSYIAGTIDGPVGNVKLVRIGNGTYGVALTGKVKPCGDLYNPEKAEKPVTTGREFDSLFVRHWDHYTTENRNAIFLATLYKEADKYKLSELKNALKGSKLESPIDPFGGTDNFDISTHGLVFTAKDPDLNPATHTKTNIYLSASKNFWLDIAKGLPEFFEVPISNFEGASTSPVWDKTGTSIAFLSMKTDGYESDKNQLFVIPDYVTPGWVIHHFPGGSSGQGTWDRSPQSIAWGGNDTLYLTAEAKGRMNLFTAAARPTGLNPVPSQLVKGGYITSVKVLNSGDIFLTSTSLIESSLYSTVPADHAKRTLSGQSYYTLPVDESPYDPKSSQLITKYVSSSTHCGGMFGIYGHQVSEISWPGAADDTDIHAFVIKPSNFKEGKTYPLAYLIHGGPQGAWGDSWSTRWNPVLFAEQGYVVITPNPTGSTGYGQKFVDAIQNQWGGLPYEDLVLGFDYIQKNLPYVDTDHAVALGASYGGYMMNWIQGHDLGRKFKALVTHDGVFSMTSQLASEELYFPFHDLGGTLWNNSESWSKWDPSRFAGNWATPHLIVHSELDYRLTMNEGLSAFNVLQTKGVHSKLLYFPDENHWVLKPENSLKWHEVVFDWINEHAGLEKYTVWRAGNVKKQPEDS
ncbi:dipeptidyl-peptidase-like protein V precursor [Massarina eburnea CBS 473.64]|uniref:Dipeptidyl-peptidase V n=1 Tax=Massarina eburnea CBS 473.64 TaxID=1395130 RepID=A0A6A6RGC7_9PLEO|nr:dipeptidyl-peptidase-like protein V precursor [Massarina eburnea CBS 473.64]